MFLYGKKGNVKALVCKPLEVNLHTKGVPDHHNSLIIIRLNDHHIEVHSSLVIGLKRLANRDHMTKQPSQRDENPPDGESVFQYGYFI